MAEEGELEVAMVGHPDVEVDGAEERGDAEGLVSRVSGEWTWSLGFADPAVNGASVPAEVGGAQLSRVGVEKSLHAARNGQTVCDFPFRDGFEHISVLVGEVCCFGGSSVSESVECVVPGEDLQAVGGGEVGYGALGGGEPLTGSGAERVEEPGGTCAGEDAMVAGCAHQEMGVAADLGGVGEVYAGDVGQRVGALCDADGVLRLTRGWLGGGYEYALAHCSLELTGVTLTGSMLTRALPRMSRQTVSVLLPSGSSLMRPRNPLRLPRTTSTSVPFESRESTMLTGESE